MCQWSGVTLTTEESRKRKRVRCKRADAERCRWRPGGAGAKASTREEMRQIKSEATNKEGRRIRTRRRWIENRGELISGMA